MKFKKYDLVRVKGSVKKAPNRLYDGVIVSDKSPILDNDILVIDVFELSHKDYQILMLENGSMYPSTIFDKVGEMNVFTEPLKNDTHYHRTKKEYPNFSDKIAKLLDELSLL